MSSKKIEFTESEFMISQAARLLEDNKTFFVGFGLPQVVALLAQRLYTPNIVQLFEFGAVGPLSLTPFVRGTMGGPTNTYRSIQWSNMNIAFSYAATGYIDYGMLGAAQIDRYGNINSTMLGKDFSSPLKRFPGSGGGNQVASFCWKTIVVMKHEARRFVDKVDFITSPGYITGKGARERSGLPKQTKVWKLVTSKALFGFDEEREEMRLEGVLRGTDIDVLLEDLRFKPMINNNVIEINPPSDDELHILRKEIDPSRVIIGGKPDQDEKE